MTLDLKMIFNFRIMNSDLKIFNRDRKILHLNRAANKFDQHNFLYLESANRIANQFDDIVKKRFDKCLNISARNGYLTEILKENNICKKIYEIDISDSFIKKSNNENKVIADEEFLPFKNESFDLIVSNLSLHWVNDLVGVLAQIKRILKKDGFFCANIFGARTLVEFRNAILFAEQNNNQASPRISPFIDVKDGAGLLQRVGFKEPVSISEDIMVKYNNIFELMIDIRNCGEANSLEKLNPVFVGKDFFNQVQTEYKNNFADAEGLLNANFELVTISGWKV